MRLQDYLERLNKDSLLLLLKHIVKEFPIIRKQVIEMIKEIEKSQTKE